MNEVKQKVDQFLENQECPNCGRKIDSIIIGKIAGQDEIRCEFCRFNNILEMFSLVAKLEEGSVQYQDIPTSVSDWGPAEKDESGKITDSPWVKMHLSEHIFGENIEEFLKNYISLIIFAKRSVAELVIPKTQKVNLATPVEEAITDNAVAAQKEN